MNSFLELRHCHIPKMFTDSVISDFVYTAKVGNTNRFVPFKHVVKNKDEITSMHVSDQHALKVIYVVQLHIRRTFIIQTCLKYRNSPKPIWKLQREGT